MTLESFLAESNRIEGITEVTDAEVSAAQIFLGLYAISVADVVAYVKVTQPNAVFRNRAGLNVMVGDYIAPLGGPKILDKLVEILDDANADLASAYYVHVDYEKLHPFTDGNGRSGRLLWLWQMNRFHGGAPLGFLHHFYYQALGAAS